MGPNSRGSHRAKSQKRAHPLPYPWDGVCGRARLLHRVPAALRLWDPASNTLVPTLAEAERNAKEAERNAKEAERNAKEAECTAKENALTEIARLKQIIART
jgi:hypothetical protein